MILTQNFYRYGVQRGVRLRNIDFRNKKNALLSTTVLLNNSDKSFKDRLWGEVCEAVVSEWSQLDGREKREKGK